MFHRRKKCMNRICSFLDELILKNEVEKQLADIKNTLIFERNTRRVCLANRMFHHFKYSSYPKHLKHLLLSGLGIGTGTYFPFLFTCVWQLQPIHVSLWQHETSERTTAHETTTSKEGEVRLGEKNNMLTNGFAKKALQYIRTCRWSQTRYTNRRV